jgi:phosphoribosylformylglycinamidine synthase
MKNKAVVKVKLKDEVLDPQGKAVLSVLKSSGYNNIKDVRIGKYIELEFNVENNAKNNDDTLMAELKEISEKVLSNPLIEYFDIEIIN